MVIEYGFNLMMVNLVSLNLSDELWGDVFEPLLELENFRNFKFGEGHDTIFWDHGADFAPEFLYEKMVIQNLLV
jgi:hypothetical protein